MQKSTFDLGLEGWEGSGEGGNSRGSTHEKMGRWERCSSCWSLELSEQPVTSTVTVTGNGLGFELANCC